MYCDSMEGGSQYECGGAGAADCSAPLPPAPRLTVFKTLVELLREEAAGKLKIKSITTTGHSLGGALASMCAFDLSRASSAALPITDADKARAARVPKQPAEGETSLVGRFGGWRAAGRAGRAAQRGRACLHVGPIHLRDRPACWFQSPGAVRPFDGNGSFRWPGRRPDGARPQPHHPPLSPSAASCPCTTSPAPFPPPSPPPAVNV
jgi:hypothetical protein